MGARLASARWFGASQRQPARLYRSPPGPAVEFISVSPPCGWSSAGTNAFLQAIPVDLEWYALLREEKNDGVG
jgi:hypothetical protein